MSVGLCAWHKTSVAYEPERCLAVCAPHVGCARCVEICPTRALRDDGRHIIADPGCIACGRCAAECPTGAIAVAGFAVAMPAAAPSIPVEVECRRVPATAAKPDAVRVPCLGGLAPYALLEMQLDAGDRPVHLIDRGWCGACPAGGNTHPAQASLARATALLAAIGAAAQAPVLVQRPLPKRRAATPPHMDKPSAPARRLLLRRLAATDDRAGGDGRPLGRGIAGLPLDPVAKRRTVAALHRLSERLNVPVPRLVSPVVAISQYCRNHQVCTKVCPTGALAADTTASVTGIVFDSARCIACSACVRHCPEHAVSLRMEPLSAGQSSGPITLTQHRQRTCRLCQRPFAEPGAETECPACRKTRALARAAFAFRFGPGAVRDDQPQGAPPGPAAIIGVIAHPI